MITNLREVLAYAEAKGSAIGSFNGYDYLSLRAPIEASEELKLPVIVAFGESYGKNMAIDEVSTLFNSLAKRTKQLVVLHLDHCKDYSLIVKAIKTGFTSVMYDGSFLPYEENWKNTREIVKIAHAAGVSVEAELGSIAGGEFSNEGGGIERYTEPSIAKDFVEKTGVDALAVSIGTVHGMYKGVPNISIPILEEIHANTSIPLVLHGGSGTPEKDLRTCIENGIRKINVNTEISVEVIQYLRQKFLKEKNSFHLSQLMFNEMEVMIEVIKKYMRMFQQ